jgi:uncharacterized membrane protein YfcA
MRGKARTPTPPRPPVRASPKQPTWAPGGALNSRTQKRQHPALRAALTLLIPWLVIQLTGALLFQFLPNPVQIVLLLLYFFNGYIAAGFYKEGVKIDKQMQTHCVQAGAAAGLTLSIGGWIILAFLLLIMSNFLMFFNGSAIYCVGPIEILMALLVSALGGSANRRL